MSSGDEENGDGRRLTGKQQAFVDYYVIHNFNATEAARRAGYAGNNATLRKVASENLTKGNIQAAIAEKVADRGMEADEVIKRLAEQGRADYSRYLREDGAVDIGQMVRDGNAHLIRCIRETAHGRTVEFHDAQKALVQMGRVYGLFVDKLAPTTPDGTEEYGKGSLATILALDGLVGLYESIRASGVAPESTDGERSSVDPATGGTE